MPVNTYRPHNQKVLTGFDFNSLYAQAMCMNSCNHGILKSEKSILTNFFTGMSKETVSLHDRSPESLSLQKP